MNFRVAMKEDAYIIKNEKFHHAIITRLHNPADVVAGELAVGMIHMLPGGGCEMIVCEKELWLYVQKGKTGITMDDGQEYTLEEKDSIHIAVGTGYALAGKSSEPAELVMVEADPSFKEKLYGRDENNEVRSAAGSYKITKADAFYSYVPVANTHRDCLTCRLTNAKDVRFGRLENGISFYLPFAGGVHMPGDQYEMIYYVTEGEFTCPDPAGGKVKLHRGDSVHFGAGNFRIADVSGTETVTMLTLRILPKDDPLCGN